MADVRVAHLWRIPHQTVSLAECPTPRRGGRRRRARAARAPPPPRTRPRLPPPPHPHPPGSPAARASPPPSPPLPPLLAPRSHLEELGIGRPSTYATIMRSPQERGHCTMVARTFRPHQRGELVTALLTCDELAAYVDTTFTATLEARLDAFAGDGAAATFLGDFAEFQPAVAAVADRDTIEPATRSPRSALRALPLAPARGRGGTDAAAADGGGDAAAPDAPAAARPGRAPELRRRVMAPASRYGSFVGCTEYPTCGWTTAARAGRHGQRGLPHGSGRRRRGEADAAAEPSLAGKRLEVSVRDGPIGWYAARRQRHARARAARAAARRHDEGGAAARQLARRGRRRPAARPTSRRGCSRRPTCGRWCRTSASASPTASGPPTSRWIWRGGCSRCRRGWGRTRGAAPTSSFTSAASARTFGWRCRPRARPSEPRPGRG